ncbi:MAG: dihydroorotase family protein [Alphaproteobacteria bacterium]|nr:dihydroorotase family protein [Alphaproteobacteria bacterium]MCB9699252.1 dihydroorotase family protein [Alphaproteobacteria bacterium]
MPGTLTVRRARLVLRDRVVLGDLAVEDGVIARIAPRIEGGGEEIDADGRLLLPGAVDLDWRFERPDELGPRTRAALRGGVTTIVAAGLAEDREALAEEHDLAGGDVVTHLGIWQRASAERGRLPLAERARGWLLDGGLLHDERVDDWLVGAERVVVVDPVDPRRLQSRAVVYGDHADVLDHARICDVDSAVAGVSRALDLARRHGARLHLLHVGSAEEAELLATANVPRVTAAVRMHSLLLDEQDTAELRERAVTEPPLRRARHREALAEAVRAGHVDVVAPGDRHVPYKHKSQPWPATPVGGPAAEWLVPLLATCVPATPWPVLARAMAEEPARIAGLTRKGRLEVGWDADLVLFDDRVGAEIETIHSPSGWSVYAGRATGGRVDLVVLGGRVALRGDEVVGGVWGDLV